MAEDSDLEKTEPASQKRLDEAREKGRVARSRELPTFAILLASGVTLTAAGPGLMQSFALLMRDALSFDPRLLRDPGLLGVELLHQAVGALLALAPFLAIAAAAALVAPILVSGWVFTAQSFQPDFSRLNPMSGLGRMFSWTSVIELVKAVLKAALVGGVAGWLLWREREHLATLASLPLEEGLARTGDLLSLVFLTVVGAMALLVLIDVPYQLWNFHKELRMTKEEARQEAKEMEGDPQIKARIRALQREMARRRMMAEVPKADVIVTNPVHYAVALAYRAGGMRAPRVVAKGARMVAEQIQALGRENKVPVLESPALARALYSHCELGREIPVELFNAVAEVLAYVYELRRVAAQGGAAPRAPGDVAVPEGMDPGAEEA